MSTELMFLSIFIILISLPKGLGLVVPSRAFVSQKSATTLFAEKESYDNENTREYFATCIPGLANILSNELIDLGAKNVEVSGTSGVSFTNDPSSNVDVGMKALLWVRSAHRIMELVSTTEDFDDWIIEDRDGLYEFVQSTIPVQALLGDGKGGLLTLSVSTTLNGNIPKELCHSHYTGLTVKNAIVDLVREKREDGVRPDVDVTDPGVPLALVLRGNQDRRGGCHASLFRVLHSGGSLHKRGYRVSTVHKAAMKESLAAGLLMEAGYNKLIEAAKKDGLPAVLVDPMAGSGTFLCEAAMIASDYAPGLARMKYYDGDGRNIHQLPPVVLWKGTDKGQWKELVLEARDRAGKGLKWMKEENEKIPGRKNCVIVGNEFNPNAAALARSNVQKAGFSDIISLNEGDCRDWNLGGFEDEESPLKVVVPGRSIIACNPPWGVRLDENIEESWLSLKSFLRDQCNESEAWILSGNKATTKFLRMKKSRSVVIRTGDEDLRWIQYHVFKKKGSDPSKVQRYDQVMASGEDGFY